MNFDSDTPQSVLQLISAFNRAIKNPLHLILGDSNGHVNFKFNTSVRKHLLKLCTKYVVKTGKFINYSGVFDDLCC